MTRELRWLSALALTALLAPASARADGSVEGHLAAAQRAMGKRDFKAAIVELRAAAKLSKVPCVDCQKGLAECYVATGDRKGALQATDVLLAAAPDAATRSFAWNERGMAWLAGSGSPKSLREAEAAFRRAIAAGGSEYAQFNLGVTLLREREDDAGRAALRDWLAMHPESVRAAAAARYVEQPERARAPFLPDDFAVVTLAGKHLTSRDFAGKVVLLDFWGTWCGPCQVAVPGLRRLAKRMQDDPFVVVSVAKDVDAETVRKYAAAHAMTWPQVWQKGDALLEAFDVKVFPTYVVAAADGEIVYKAEGFSDHVEREVAREVGRQIDRARRAAADGH